MGFWRIAKFYSNPIFETIKSFAIRGKTAHNLPIFSFYWEEERKVSKERSNAKNHMILCFSQHTGQSNSLKVWTLYVSEDQSIAGLPSLNTFEPNSKNNWVWGEKACLGLFPTKEITGSTSVKFIWTLKWDFWVIHGNDGLFFEKTFFGTHLTT